MTNFEIAFFLTGGLLCLFLGAEALIRGSSSLALRMGITPLVVGLTVVAFGTSSPELVISINASLQNNGGISLGNVIGSNICNIALILGTAALIRPMRVQTQIVKREIPVMIFVSMLFFFFMANKFLGRIEGIVLVIGIIIYVIFSVIQSRIEVKKELIEEGVPKKLQNIWISIILTLAGLGLLIFGSTLFVDGAVSLAESLGISQIIIGLTIVAIGTSLPEFVTSVVAAVKNEADIAIGNVVGSNIFNILAIIGIAGIVNPLNGNDVSFVDLGIMMIFAVILLPLSKSGFTINRWEGAVLLIGYVAYIFYLIP